MGLNPQRWLQRQTWLRVILRIYFFSPPFSLSCCWEWFFVCLAEDWESNPKNCGFGRGHASLHCLGFHRTPPGLFLKTEEGLLLGLDSYISVRAIFTVASFVYTCFNLCLKASAAKKHLDPAVFWFPWTIPDHLNNEVHTSTASNCCLEWNKSLCDETGAQGAAVHQVSASPKIFNSWLCASSKNRPEGWICSCDTRVRCKIAWSKCIMRTKLLCDTTEKCIWLTPGQDRWLI